MKANNLRTTQQYKAVLPDALSLYRSSVENNVPKVETIRFSIARLKMEKATRFRLVILLTLATLAVLALLINC